MPVPTLRPLGFGEILDGAFSLYRRNFGPFVGTALVPMLAALAVGLLYAARMVSEFERGATMATVGSALMGPLLLVMVVGTVVTLLAWGALAHLATQAFTGASVSVGDGLRAGLRSLPALLGAGLLALVAIFFLAMGMGIISLIVVMIGGALGGPVAAVLAGLMMVGMVLVFAVGAALFAGAIPTVVLEGKGPLSGFTRSFDLLRGAFWRVLGVITVSMTIAYLPLIAITLLTGTSSMFNPQSASVPGAAAVFAQQVLAWMGTVLTTPFVVSAIVLNYFDRRVRTEGLDVHMMADGLADRPLAAAH